MTEDSLVRDKIFSARIGEEPLEKLRVIAKNVVKSINSEINLLIREAIKGHEKQHNIPISEN